MLELLTDRLRLFAPNFSQVQLFFQNRRQFERALGLKETTVALTGDDTMDFEARDAYPKFMSAFKKDQERFHWYSFWQVVLKSENRIIGSFGFGGPPNEQGEIMLGYVTEPAFQNKGYMTETIREAVRWVFEQPGVASIIATVPIANSPSHRVLEKNGFSVFKKDDVLWWWKRTKNSSLRPS
jgi:ribosomal-protein-alanine N-acetyltransferase